MAVVTIHRAKTELSKLIARAEAGEEIIIARKDKPVVRLTVVAQQADGPKPGVLAHLPPIPDSFFFDPLPDDELAAFGTDD